MPASIGVNMRVTGHYSQGGRKHMEDKFSVAYQQTEDERDLEYAYFGIFDGHGGAEAAAYAKDHLMEAIVRQKHFWSDDDADVLRAIRNGYMMTHMNMWKELEKWPKVIYGLPSTAGTTASVAFIRRGKIYIGHVGDSAIVLGYQIEGKEEWSAMPLTMDHKPESEAEMQRIQSSGGKVMAKSGVPRVVWNRHVAGKGPEQVPFLAIARSLGDHWSYNTSTDEFVVSPDPDVGVLAIDPARFRCLIFGTDGLWNMISPKNAVELVQQAQKHNELAAIGVQSPDSWQNPSKILVDNAIDRWANTKVRADNTSVVTVMMDPPGPPRSRAPHPPPMVRPKPVADQAGSSQKLDSPMPAMSEPATGENSFDNRNHQELSRMMPPSLPAPNSIAPLPPVTNIPQYSQACRLSSPMNNPTFKDDEEEHNYTSNYGNPADSYFIARLLNKTQIKNSLQHVYDEIMKSNLEQPNKIQESEELVNNNNNILENKLSKRPSSPTTHVISPVVPEEEVNAPEETTDDSTKEIEVKSEEKEKVEEEPQPEILEKSSNPANEQESIQINEVSSSSPVDSPPKPRKRKYKGLSKFGTPNAPVRNLRSHDALQTPIRPQTRLNADKNRLSCIASSVQSNQRKHCESKVPVPVHTSKPTLQSGKVVVLQPKPKLSISPSVIGKQAQSAKSDKKIVDKNIKIQKSSTNNTKIDKVENKTKILPTKSISEPAVNTPNTRITRSKDNQLPPADVLLKTIKDSSSASKKFPSSPESSKSLTSNTPVEKPKDFLRTSIVTRHKTSNVLTFCTPKGIGGSIKGRNSDQNLEGNSECCKENMVTPINSNVRAGSLKSVKRRNSGGGTVELEPKEKRRTRLGDKRQKTEKQEQHEDVTSTESLKESGFMLGLPVCNIDHNCIPESSNERCVPNVEESADLTADLTQKLKPKNKKDSKVIKSEKSEMTSDNIAGEVHSTTLHLESDTLCKNGTDLVMRALRPRHDGLQLTDKKLSELKSGDKRVLRSTNGSTDSTEKECRPILRTRNSVGTLPSRGTARRRIQWPQSLRHNLRKRLTTK